MSEERAKIIDKAKKLRELANRGVDGEKDTAKRMYDAYKKKHKLTDDEVDGHEYTDDFVNYTKGKSDEELIEEMAKGLIILGVGLIFSLLSGIFDDRKGSSKSNSKNKKRAEKMSEIFDDIKKSKKNKNRKKMKDYYDTDKTQTEEQKEIQKEIELNLKNDKKNDS